MELAALRHKSPDFGKLTEFGFVADNEVYTYRTQIVDGQFEMTVRINGEREADVCLVDRATDELYTLHLVEGATGAFVGRVRSEFDDVLRRIADSCFKRDVFKEIQAKQIISYISDKYGDELEFLWEKLPTGAIWRRKDNRKWYGILMIISKRKLGLDSDELISVIDLRLDPEQSIADGKRYFAGYHMNKRTWFTICLDGSVPTEEICGYIDKSYMLAFPKKIKK